MLNLSYLHEADLSTIDTRTLTPAEWEAYKNEVVRRAQARRVKLVRDLLAHVFGRKVDAEADTPHQLAFSFKDKR